MKDIKELLESFSKYTDKELADLLGRLPVSDIQAMSKKYLNPDMFVEFCKVMKITLSYELLIHKCYANIIALIDSAQQGGNTQLSRDVRREINYLLTCAKRYKQLVKQDRDRLKHGRKPQAIVLPRTNMEVFNLMPPAADDFLLLSDLYFDGLTEENVQLAIAEVEKAIKNSNNRISTARRREFRKSVIRNYDWVYSEFLPVLRKNYQLHHTKIDRIVIDVYDERLFTYLSEVFESIEDNEGEITQEGFQAIFHHITKRRWKPSDMSVRRSGANTSRPSHSID